MKKYIALLLCVAVLVGLTACNLPKEDASSSGATQSTATTTVGEGSTTATTDGGNATADATATTTTGATGTDGTTATPPTGGTTVITTAPIGTGTPSVPSSTAPTKTSSSSTTATKPSGSQSKPSSTATAPTASSATEPSVILPAIGSDIDVTNQKDRIRVSAASAEFNKDGSIAVSLTFKNYSTNWITEETDYVEYTCYDAAGNVVQAAAKIQIGCIDTKKNAVKTFTFDVPANTAEVRLTRSKIVYWTEWS